MDIMTKRDLWHSIGLMTENSLELQLNCIWLFLLPSQFMHQFILDYSCPSGKSTKTITVKDGDSFSFNSNPDDADK